MKYSEIQNLKADELRKRIHQNRMAWFEARMKGKMGRLSNFQEIADFRQDQARLQTALVKFNRENPQEELKKPAPKPTPVKKSPPPWKRKKSSRLQAKKQGSKAEGAYQSPPGVRQKASVSGTTKKGAKPPAAPLKKKTPSLKPSLKTSSPAGGEVSKQRTGLLRKGWSFLFQRKAKGNENKKNSGPPEGKKGVRQ